MAVIYEIEDAPIDVFANSDPQLTDLLSTPYTVAPGDSFIGTIEATFGLSEFGDVDAVRVFAEEGQRFAVTVVGALSGAGPIVDPDLAILSLDLSRFDAAPLIAFTATKETDYGTETNGRIPR